MRACATAPGVLWACTLICTACTTCTLCRRSSCARCLLCTLALLRLLTPTCAPALIRCLRWLYVHTSSYFTSTRVPYKKSMAYEMLFILLTIVLVVLSAFCHAQTKDQEINVPKRGLEPPRGCPHYDLNVARLPIPPLRLAVLCNIFHSIHHHPAPARTAPPLCMYVLYSVF